MCKGTMKEEATNFTSDMGGCIVVVKSVPSHVCGQCGETTYNDEVARQLEQIVQRVKETAITEIAVISYTKKAA